MANSDLVFGIHAVQALLKMSPQRIQELRVVRGRQDQRIQSILDSAKNAGLVVQMADKRQLDELCSGRHQGVIAFASPGQIMSEGELYPFLEQLAADPLVLVLDGVTDPHNLGACMRSADAAGVHAVVVPKDNSAGLTDTARKVASGAAEAVPLIAVTNLSRTLKKLQQQGLWIAGAAGEAELTIYQAELTGPRVIVMGAEGSGMRRLTRETCDNLIKIPMHGSVSSLNVSVATGIVLFEVQRQRSVKA